MTRRATGNAGPNTAAADPGDRPEIGRLVGVLAEKADRIRELATLAVDCRADLPLSRALTLSIDKRIVAGDVRAIRDAVTDFVADLEVWIGDYDAAVGDDPETAARLLEVLATKKRRGELKWDPGEAGGGGEPDDLDDVDEDYE